MPKAKITLSRGGKLRRPPSQKGQPRFTGAVAFFPPPAAANDSSGAPASSEVDFLTMVHAMSQAERAALAGLLRRMMEGGKPRAAVVCYLVEIGFSYAQASIRADRAMASYPQVVQ